MPQDHTLKRSSVFCSSSLSSENPSAFTNVLGAIKVFLVHHAMKVYKGAAEVQHHLLFTSTVDEGEWSASCPGSPKPEKETAPVSIHYEAGLAPEVA